MSTRFNRSYISDGKSPVNTSSDRVWKQTSEEKNADAPSTGTPTDASSETSVHDGGEGGLLFDGNLSNVEVENPWSEGFESGLRKTGLSISDGITGYNRWAKATGGKPLDIMEFAPYMLKKDPTKSLAENEADEKKAKRREDWEQAAGVLSHLGNFIGTLHGSPTQPLESAQELTKRQQELRDKTETLRRSNGGKLMEWYNRQRADELANAKEERAQQAMDLNQAEFYLKEKQFEWKKLQDEGKMDIARQKLELDRIKNETNRMVQMGRLSQGAQRIILQEANLEFKKSGKVSEKEETRINPVTGQQYTYKSKTVSGPNSSVSSTSASTAGTSSGNSQQPTGGNGRKKVVY